MWGFPVEYRRYNCKQSFQMYMYPAVTTQHMGLDMGNARIRIKGKKSIEEYQTERRPVFNVTVFFN